jgi:hypothetical protein
MPREQCDPGSSFPLRRIAKRSIPRCARDEDPFPCHLSPVTHHF